MKHCILNVGMCWCRCSSKIVRAPNFIIRLLFDNDPWLATNIGELLVVAAAVLFGCTLVWRTLVCHGVCVCDDFSGCTRIGRRPRPRNKNGGPDMHNRAGSCTALIAALARFQLKCDADPRTSFERRSSSPTWLPD